MTSAILRALTDGPRLVRDLPEASAFPHRDLTLPDSPGPLNFQQKLGHLYEDALALLLLHSARFELLERNLQIQENRHATLGELDFLVRDLIDDALIHLELATKFYLVVQTNCKTLLPGPDARDNYHRKISRLRNHQLQLARNHRPFLPEKYQQETITPAHLIYGCLFDHISQSEPHAPEWISPTARRGKWLTIDELPAHTSPSAPVRIIPKPLWPVPVQLLNNIELEPFSPGPALDRCLMVLPPCGTNTWFVTPSNYPDHQR